MLVKMESMDEDNFGINNAVWINRNLFGKDGYFIKQFLNFSRKWTSKDVKFLDDLVQCLHSGAVEEKKYAFLILSKFMEDNNNALTRVDVMLGFSKSFKVQCFALEILENLIKTKWESYSVYQRFGFRKYILSQIWSKTNTNKLSKENKKILNMLNRILIQILKYEYPRNCPTFIEDLLTASKAGTVRCLNTLAILKHMNIYILGTSNKQLSRFRAKKIRESKNKIFREIFHFCNFVLKFSRDSKLLYCTLETMLQYVSWIPSGVIFEAKFPEMLIKRYGAMPNKYITILLLIAIVRLCDKKYYDRLGSLFTAFVMIHWKMLGSEESMTEEACAKNDILHFYSIVFVSTIIKKNPELYKTLPFFAYNNVFSNLIKLSSRRNTKIIKLCTECLKQLVCDLSSGRVSTASYHYPLMSELRKLIISRIAKPRVMIKQRKKYQIPDLVQIYANMKEILIHLTFMDHTETTTFIVQKLNEEMDYPGLSVKNLNALCCATVSIKGMGIMHMGVKTRCMPVEVEEKFFWEVFQALTTLSRVKKGSSNQDVITLNIMCVISVYANYLNSRWFILKLFIRKLFGFMHGTNPVLRVLACKTFICIAHRCKKKFIENQPSFNKIVRCLRDITSDLRPDQVSDFIQALGHIAVSDSTTVGEKVIRERIKRILIFHNLKFEFVMKQIRRSTEVIMCRDFFNDVIDILKVNTGACRGMGYKYIYQFENIYESIFILYNCINIALKSNNPMVKEHTLKDIKTLQEQMLKLISTWIGSLRNKNQNLIVNGIFGMVFNPISEKDIMNSSGIRFRLYLEVLYTLVAHCFNALFYIVTPDSDRNFKVVMNILKRAISQSQVQNIKILGLKTLLLIFQNIEIKLQKERDRDHSYLHRYIINNCDGILKILLVKSTDTSGISYKAHLLSYVIKFIRRKKIGKTKISLQLSDVPKIIANQYVYLSRNQVEKIVGGICKHYLNIPALTEYLRDMPVLIEEWKINKSMQLKKRYISKNL